MDLLSYALWSIILILPAIYYYFQWKFSYWKRKGVPYMEPSIPFGNIKSRKGIHIREWLAEFYKRKGEFPFIGSYAFVFPQAIVTDLDLAQNILIRNFNNFTDHGVYHNEEDDPLSATLFSVDGQKWKTLRTKLSPTFTSGRMKFMFPTVVEVAERFNQTLEESIKVDKTLEIKELLARFTTDVIGTCAFGIECNSLKDPNTKFRKYGRKHLEERYYGFFASSLMSAFPGIAKKLHLRQTQPDVAEFFLGIVRETVDYREKNNIRRNDFMDLLIQLKNNAKLEGEDSIIGKLSFEELAAQAFIFFVGGFETSSTTMGFTMYELSVNQEVQDKCRQEINEVLKKHNGKLTYEAMLEMTYIENTILETLRKYPILAFIIRKCVADYAVPATNVTIDKGTPILIPAFSIQHDPEYYPDPEKFEPDRFLPENVRSRHPMTFLSFGDGPRNCIGLRFGKMQARIGLVTLLKNYRFKLSPKTSSPLILSRKMFLLSAEGGIYLELEKI